MEGGGGGNGRRTRLSSREVSPDRARGIQPRFPRVSARKVQIVYYLSRNGQLEHPHFMELSQLPNQHIRLKDVMDRLTALRGKGMPSLYSWSCKRSYKNGYVWNDLSENDVIYPSDGAEYVLKGSEILPGCSERFHQLQVRFPPKALSISHKPYIEPDDEQYEVQTDDTDEQDPLEHDYRGNIATGARRTLRAPTVTITHKKPQSNRSRQIELPLEDASPPSSSSSDKLPNLSAEPGPESGPTRPNSVFLQLIACGAATVSAKGSARKSSGGLHRGVISRLATGQVGLDDEFGQVSHNQRCGGLSVEDKEYFSGSIVEAGRRAVPEPALKKSNSYNEERSTRLGIGEETAGATGEEEGQVRAGDGVKGKCIPTRKKSSAKLQAPKQ
ncbi:protein SOSEKI 2-like [Carex rostrata]